LPCKRPPPIVGLKLPTQHSANKEGLPSRASRAIVSVGEIFAKGPSWLSAAFAIAGDSETT
jgi:hypothetical protein